MHPLRRLSVWGSVSAAELPGADDAPRHRHRRLHHHREKRYDALPLGGNRPILTAPAADDQQRKHSRCRRRRHSPSTSEEEESADVRTTPALNDDDPAAPPSPREQPGEQPRPGDALSATQTATPYQTTPEGGAYPPPSPATDEREKAHSRRRADGLRHSSGTSVQPVAIATPARRRGADGSGDSAPPTPTTPTSPLEQARLRNRYDATQPTAPYPIEPEYAAYSPTVAAGPAVDEQVRGEKHGRRPCADGLPHASSSSPTRPSHSHAPRAVPSARPSGDPLTPPTSPTSPLERARWRNSRAATLPTAPYPTTPAPAPEDAFEMLARFDTALVVDDSGSMAAHWGATQRALETVARVAVQHDVDGIDLYFLNDAAHSAQRVRQADDVTRAFARVEPRGITPTAACLDAIMRPYLARLAADPTVKPLNIVVLTDGEPTDDPESVIVAAARRLDRLNAPLHQLGVQFLQIGTDAAATAALRELDDALAAIHDVRDIVDTTPYADDAGGISGDVLLKALLGGVNRRLDRWG